MATVVVSDRSGTTRWPTVALVAFPPVLTGVNTAHAAWAGTRQAPETAILARSVPSVLEAVGNQEGEVLVSDTLADIPRPGRTGIFAAALFPDERPEGSGKRP